MLINILLIFISIFFNLVKIIYVKIFPHSKFQTFPGFVLLKFRFDFVNLYLSRFNIPLILITGTNGKTSTTHLLTHILKSKNYKILTNYSGSNLKRGILSTLVLHYIFSFKHKYDYLVLEVDEGSVLDLSKSIPDNISQIFLILLNLSRDQLDRYGEIDTIASKINEALLLKNIKLITKNDTYTHIFTNFTPVTPVSNLEVFCKNLFITNSPHLCENLEFILTLTNILGLEIPPTSLKPFELVIGRGKILKIKNLNLELHLSKNPASFNNNLKLLSSSKIENVLIVMNDNIPDGRDVSWFYDIDFQLLKSVLSKKKVYVSGSRSYDFFNLLKVIGISTFNSISFENYLKFATIYNLDNTFILSNYSATVSISKSVNQ